MLIHQGGTASDTYDKTGCNTLTGPIVDIAAAVDPAVTAIISGHTHQGYNCVVNGRTVIQGDFYGHLLQRLDLKLDTKAHKVLEVKAANVVMDTRSIAKNADMTALVAKAKSLTDAVKLQPVAPIAAPASAARRTPPVKAPSATSSPTASSPRRATPRTAPRRSRS